MEIRKIIACALIAALPMSAMAQDYVGVVGTRLLSDHYGRGDDLYLGFVNDTSNTVRITRVRPDDPSRGFRTFDMPQELAPWSAPQRVSPDAGGTGVNELMRGTGLDFAPFPQKGQGDFRFRHYLVGEKYKEMRISPDAVATYRLSPEGPDAGPQSGVELTVHWDRVSGGFNLERALVIMGAGAGSTGVIGSGWMLASVLKKNLPLESWAARWAYLRGAATMGKTSVARMFLTKAVKIGSIAGLVMTLGEGAYYTGASALAGHHMFSTTHAFALLGGPGVQQLMQTPLQQVVRSPDGQFEYTLSLRALPYATGEGHALVPAEDDGLIVVGIRHVWSAQNSCQDLHFVDSDHAGELLSGTCRDAQGHIPPQPSKLDIGLCTAHSDVFNDNGKLDCPSRFSGPFEHSFHKYDGNLRGAYLYTDGQLEVYSDDEHPRALATLQNPEMCVPGSITFTARTHMKSIYTLSCQYR